MNPEEINNFRNWVESDDENNHFFQTEINIKDVMKKLEPIVNFFGYNGCSAVFFKCTSYNGVKDKKNRISKMIQIYLEHPLTDDLPALKNIKILKNGVYEFYHRLDDYHVGEVKHKDIKRKCKGLYNMIMEPLDY
jgi:hypothetical protein